MVVELKPSAACGTVPAPASKSFAHRYFLCAALARGVSTVRGVTPSEDLLATADCLRALGAEIDWRGDTVRIAGTDLSEPPRGKLPCRACGTTLRFLIPVALLTGREVTLTGTASLMKRPLSVFSDLCRERGFRFDCSEESVTVCGRLTSGTYSVPGGISSQFVSGLALALSFLDGESEIAVLPPVESRSYLLMTVGALRRFGVEAAFTEDGIIRIAGGSRFIPADVTVEGDWSNAAFLDAFNVLGGSVRVTGLNPESVQGDRIYPEFFERIRTGTPVLNLADMPDLGPVCMALAAACHGAEFEGVRRLRLKESDRCAAMAEELGKFGVRTVQSPDRMTVEGGLLRPPAGLLSGHGDHRIVMADAVLASLTGGRIDGAEAVGKSFPDFFFRLKELGLEVSGNGMDL